MDSMLAYETFHAMGLYHTFDDHSTFTFEKFKTDNIMDYSDIGPDKIPVISTFIGNGAFYKTIWKRKPKMKKLILIIWLFCTLSSCISQTTFKKNQKMNNTFDIEKFNLKKNDLK